MPASEAKKRAPLDGADRKKQILRAAVQVFAERGFHRTRVSDIAKEAGVAYGLIYHYFDSKDAVLNSVFEENWAVFMKVLRDLTQDASKSAADKLGAISDLLIGALRVEPALIHVIIQEVSRSDRFTSQAKAQAFEEAFEAVRAIVAEGQKRGEIRSDIDPYAAAYIFFGALETLCTGFMIGKIRCKTDGDAERLKRTLKLSMLNGMLEPQ
jgi:TetR/AcrR family transcriptional regulator, fatty acid metabolism regulator protein